MVFLVQISDGLVDGGIEAVTRSEGLMHQKVALEVVPTMLDCRLVARIELARFV